MAQLHLIRSTSSIDTVWLWETKTDVWMIGDVDSNSSSTIAFQVALNPNSSQKGSAATLVKQATISGEDQWTEVFITGTASSIKTDSSVK